MTKHSHVGGALPRWRQWVLAAGLVSASSSVGCGGKALLEVDSEGTSALTGGTGSGFSSGGARFSGGGSPGFTATGGFGAAPGKPPPSMPPSMMPPPTMMPPGPRPCPIGERELPRLLAATIWANEGLAPEVLLMLAGGLPLDSVVKLMLSDTRSDAGLRRFALDWLEVAVSQGQGGSAGQAGAAGVDTNLEAFMLEEARLMIEASLQDGQGTLERLFTSTQSWVSRPLADHYGVPHPTNFDTGPNIDLATQERFGILTRGFWLMRHANASRRGKAVLENMLCSLVPLPPVLEHDPHGTAAGPELSAQQIREQAQDPACQGCHQFTDPPGVAFEHFDGLGRRRLNSHLIDSSGYFTHSFGLGETAFKFDNVRDYMYQLQASPDMHLCLVQKVARYAHRQVNGLSDFEASALGCSLRNSPPIGATSIADAMRIVFSGPQLGLGLR